MRKSMVSIKNRSKIPPPPLLIAVLFWILPLNAMAQNTVADLLADSVFLTGSDLEQEIEAEQLWLRLMEADVVVVGEYHDQFASHHLQQAVIEQFHQQSLDFAIGVEWLPYPSQQALDDFTDSHLSDEAFIEKAKYVENWGYDYRLLQPIFHFARDHQIPMLALNAPKSVTKKISKRGYQAYRDGLNEQSSGKRDAFKTLPQQLPLAESYQDFLVRFFEKANILPKRLQRALQVQSTWDQTMAKGVVDFLSVFPKRKVLVFAGMVHADKEGGIKGALKTLAPELKVVTLGSGSLESLERIKRAGHDYFVLFDDPDAWKLAKLPFFKVKLAGQTTQIETFAKGGVAEKLDLQPGDQIISVAGYWVTNKTELMTTLWLKVDPTVEMEVVWLREDELLGVPISDRATLSEFHQETEN